MCLFGFFVKKNYLLIIMSTKDNFINFEGIQKSIEDTFNKAPDLSSTILENIRNGNLGEDGSRGIKPEDIEGMNEEEVKEFINEQVLKKSIENGEPDKIDSVNITKPPEVTSDDINVNDSPSVTDEYLLNSSIEETSTEEVLEDPQISDIFDEMRIEFPEITPTPTPGIMIEGFENVPLSSAEKINKQLKSKFMENFTF
jgi:hypothetical protein